jgi:hypothetical protein
MNQILNVKKAAEFELTWLDVDARSITFVSLSRLPS